MAQAARLCDALVPSCLLSPMLGASRQRMMHTHDTRTESQQQVCGVAPSLGVISGGFVCSFVCSDTCEKLHVHTLCAAATGSTACENDDLWAVVQCVCCGSGERVGVRERQAFERSQTGQDDASSKSPRQRRARGFDAGSEATLSLVYDLNPLRRMYKP